MCSAVSNGLYMFKRLTAYFLTDLTCSIEQRLNFSVKLVFSSHTVISARNHAHIQPGHRVAPGWTSGTVSPLSSSLRRDSRSRKTRVYTQFVFGGILHRAGVGEVPQQFPSHAPTGLPASPYPEPHQTSSTVRLPELNHTNIVPKE